MKLIGLRLRFVVLVALVMGGIALGVSAASQSTTNDGLADGGQWGNKGGKTLC